LLGLGKKMKVFVRRQGRGAVDELMRRSICKKRKDVVNKQSLNFASRKLGDFYRKQKGHPVYTESKGSARKPRRVSVSKKSRLKRSKPT
jgi:hypothetical protein